MNLLGDLLLLPVTGPYRGLKALLEALRDEADAARFSAAKVRAELSNLEMRRDVGEISEEEYQQQEAILLDRLNEILAGEESRRQERRRAEPPLIVDGEVVDPVVGEVLGVQAGDADSGYVEYVDGEYEELDDDFDEEDDGPEQDEGKSRGGRR